MALPRYDMQPEQFAPIQHELTRMVGLLSALCEAKILRNVSIGTSATKIAHGLGSIPFGVLTCIPSLNATIWYTTAADSRYLYLAASSACTVTLVVF